MCKGVRIKGVFTVSLYSTLLTPSQTYSAHIPTHFVPLHLHPHTSFPHTLTWATYSSHIILTHMSMHSFTLHPHPHPYPHLHPHSTAPSPNTCHDPNPHLHTFTHPHPHPPSPTPSPSTSSPTPTHPHPHHYPLSPSPNTLHTCHLRVHRGQKGRKSWEVRCLYLQHPVTNVVLERHWTTPRESGF